MVRANLRGYMILERSAMSGEKGIRNVKAVESPIHIIKTISEGGFRCVWGRRRGGNQGRITAVIA